MFWGHTSSALENTGQVSLEIKLRDTVFGRCVAGTSSIQVLVSTDTGLRLVIDFPDLRAVMKNMDTNCRI